jgi:alpha-L-rhamnosidase
MNTRIRLLLLLLSLSIAGVNCQRATAPQASEVAPFSEATWIAAGPELADFDTTYPAPYFRKAFDIEGNLRSATAYVTAGGYFTLYLNGEKIGDRLLDPAVTRYDKTVRYVTFDVTDELTTGNHAIGAVLANGFYNVHTESAWQFDQAPWRNRPALKLELLLEYADGHSQRIGTDETWSWSYGPITFNQLRNGEHYDARLELGDWSDPGYDGSDWLAATAVTGPTGKLVDQRMPPIRKSDTLAPVAINEPLPGTYLIDFGQNIAGWADIRLNEAAGTEVTMVYGERVREDGTIDIEELSRFIRTGETQTTRYTSAGTPNAYYEPWTTYFGFQYVQIEGLSEAPTPESIRAFAIHTDFDTVGRFETSDTLINRLHENIRWSYLGNFHSFPEDCPHREKMGWTGDAQLVIETGLFNFDVRSAFTKWLADFRDEQPASGALPGIIPTSGWGYEIGHAKQPYYGPHWEGAAITIPWQVYRWTGDTSILRENYRLMTNYLAFLDSQTQGDLLTGGIDDHKSINTHTEGHYLSTAYYHWMLQLVGGVAQVLGLPEEAEGFNSHAKEIQSAFHDKYFDPTDTTYLGGGQTPMAVALGCGLVPDDTYPSVLARLIDTIRAENYHFDAGVVGVKQIIEVLLKNNRPAILHKLATRTDFPSFGYWLTLGANTMWQNWDGSQSRNHIMFGSIGDYFYRGLAGINPVTSAPGFRRIRLAPYFPEDMDHLAADHRTPHGWLRTRWRRENDQIEYTVEIPPGTEAIFQLNGIRVSGNEYLPKDGQLILPPGMHTLSLNYAR